ncbi:MAG: GNAT family N-acetyltransferase [Deltaproteobacteria bacterium]|nr:GNAT family N-acetyltransferase [Deltaproteobacteria bacterium]
MSDRHFSASYREPVVLGDGQVVLLRLVRPEDKPLFVRGLGSMSQQSRYRRFFTSKDRLSTEELRYLTELDGEDHLAIGAVRELEGGGEDGVGVARFVRLAGEPRLAEPAVVVIDEMQGRGLGRQLLLRLEAAARERGIERFRFEVLAENEPMRQLLGELAPEAEVREEGAVVSVECPLPELPARPGREPAALRGPAHRVLSWAAEGLVLVRRAFAWR